MGTVATLTPEDLRALADRGILEDEARRQIELLERPRRWTRLARPCTAGDGIVTLSGSVLDELAALHAAAAAAGRFTKFVPASGAASRMFKGLRGDAPDLDRFFEGIERFAFHGDLTRVAEGPGADAASLAVALIGPDGLGYADLPKGLVKFHRDGSNGRTAFEEHLVEAADYVRDVNGNCRVHFTVSPEHRARFVELFDTVRGRWEAAFGVRYDVGWSEQRPSTDTLALSADGRAARDADGRLLLRPGGHGALIENLADLGGDVVFVKNIDNVQPDGRREGTSRWKRVLAGYLIRIEQQLSELLDALGDPAPSPELLDRAEVFCRRTFGVEPGRPGPDGRECRRVAVIRRLNRPLRVCGVVRNTGEPGGGPFWVVDGEGQTTRQIVEAAEVDPGDVGQQEILRGATHFNPVDLVCSMRDSNGSPHALESFVDPATSIVTAKHSEGRELRVLERPGLWNGAMAKWNTLFVEVPLETFSPVKSVLDLLRDEHQPPRA